MLIFLCLFDFSVEMVVEFDYEAEHEDELSLRLGDVIKNVRRISEEGWMEGDLNGRRGLFPDNFVKVSVFRLVVPAYVNRYRHGNSVLTELL